MEESYRKINIFWTYDNPGVFKFMVYKMARQALEEYGRGNVCLTLFGPTVKTAAEREEVNKHLLELVDDGVRVVACEDSIAQYKVREQFGSLGGIEIKKLAKRAADGALPGEKIVFF